VITEDEGRVFILGGTFNLTTAFRSAIEFFRPKNAEDYAQEAEFDVFARKT
jgi:hypothetical protein